MIYVVYALVALAGAGVHLWRHPGQRWPTSAIEVVLVWWIVVALGVAAVLCICIHDRYLLAILLVATISLWGDAYGHIHQEVVNDNHDPDNTGPILYADILFPLVGLLLYAARELRSGPGLGKNSGPTTSKGRK